MRNPLLNWLFYGHVWIALAAAALCWQSLYLHAEPTAFAPEVLFVFLGTLGVYTLHRLLSYHRAGGEPDGRRYRVVARYPRLSAAIGAGALLTAGVVAWWIPLRQFWPVLLALPFTGFYLVPVYPGGPRLRDLPYLKVVWVALAWTLMTHVFPTHGAGWTPETGTRFAFTLSIALLFDTRDVELDRRQGVRTLAAAHPLLNRLLALSLLAACVMVSVFSYPEAGWRLATAYAIAMAVGAVTRPAYGEDWYATAVNGLLLVPPVLLSF